MGIVEVVENKMTDVNQNILMTAWCAGVAPPAAGPQPPAGNLPCSGPAACLIKEQKC